MKKAMLLASGAFGALLLISACSEETSVPYVGNWSMDAASSIDESSNTFDMEPQQFVFVMEMWADQILNEVSIEPDGFLVEGDLEGDSFSISCAFETTTAAMASGPCELGMGADSTTEQVTWTYTSSETGERLVGEGLQKMIVVLERAE